MQYWRKLNADHFFKMKLIVLGKTDRLITVLIDIGDVESKLFATFTINEYGKFSRVEITYT